MEKCYCGRPLHYTSRDAEEVMHDMVARLGPNVRITVGSRTWLVPRHYIALHGISARDLPVLRFTEVTG